MPNYAAMKVELPKFKAALTRAKKKGPEEVLAEVTRAFARFDEIGYPDCWHAWNIARSDAELDIRYGWKCEDCGRYVPNHKSLCPDCRLKDRP